MAANLAFGLGRAVPDEAKAAWGARWIVTQQGHVDFVYDRQDATGDADAKAALFAWLNDTVKNAPRDAASDLLKSYRMNTREGEQFTLYEDDRGVFVGNTNGSAGYLYVAAYLK